MKLTIGRMATLYGLHRSTLYEAVQKGRVSAPERDGKGQQVIDLSEMIRVYGEAPGQARQSPTPESDTRQTYPTDDIAQAIAAAVAQAVEPLRAEIEKLRETLLRIEYKPDRADPPPLPQVVEADDPFGDIFTSLKSRQ